MNDTVHMDNLTIWEILVLLITLHIYLAFIYLFGQI